MNDGIKFRDQQLAGLETDVKKLFESLATSKHTDKVLDEIRTKLDDFAAACEGFKLELTDCQKDKQQYRQKGRQYRATLKHFKTDLAWHESNTNKRDLMAGASEEVTIGVDPTEQGLIDHGNKVMEASNESLQRSLAIVSETQMIGRSAAQQLEQQTEQMVKLYDAAEQTEQAIDRSTKILKNMARTVLTDKYIWVLVCLVITAVIAIIVYKAVDPTGAPAVNVPDLNFGQQP
mmetsp:Transcript_2227/g.2994  ORF Transcript_2227/g.2994 Transcript_2227/m.2994 type:complete len:233 (-) Transcript_2227:315-1013(-)|eukprot:CAMPEP_0175090040 /NCGR_PEP_ID=MMETSP0086_2-20121207/1112_1 /TAXON_ID=136419 /ORGANISM="Unknown Unknown, Strain D1" /LENGTH=232 /DNA_ID=CAMNT_0016362599 /DNA_START=70 /DNA_END=768 /DNA_ORIENTATION=+